MKKISDAKDLAGLPPGTYELSGSAADKVCEVFVAKLAARFTALPEPLEAAAVKAAFAGIGVKVRVKRAAKYKRKSLQMFNIEFSDLKDETQLRQDVIARLLPQCRLVYSQLGLTDCFGDPPTALNFGIFTLTAYQKCNVK